MKRAIFVLSLLVGVSSAFAGAYTEAALKCTVVDTNGAFVSNDCATPDGAYRPILTDSGPMAWASIDATSISLGYFVNNFQIDGFDPTSPYRLRLTMSASASDSYTFLWEGEPGTGEMVYHANCSMSYGDSWKSIDWSVSHLGCPNGIAPFEYRIPFRYNEPFTVNVAARVTAQTGNFVLDVPGYSGHASLMRIDRITTDVPEPGTVALVGFPVAAVCAAGYRRTRSRR